MISDWSTARTFLAPARAANIDNMPVPQPTSSTTCRIRARESGMVWKGTKPALEISLQIWKVKQEHRTVFRPERSLQRICLRKVSSFIRMFSARAVFTVSDWHRHCNFLHLYKMINELQLVFPASYIRLSPLRPKGREDQSVSCRFRLSQPHLEFIQNVTLT